MGLFFSIDRGETWARFMNGLPTVPVHDLLIHPRDNDLIAGTHGRGAWIADNITPLQQLTARAMEEDVELFEVRPETQWLTTYEFSWTTDKRFYKDNPPTGSTIAFYLKTEPTQLATLEILDIEGEVKRTMNPELGRVSIPYSGTIGGTRRRPQNLFPDNNSVSAGSARLPRFPQENTWSG